MQCRVCDHEEFEVGVDLGKQPVGLHFLRQEDVGKEPFYPLRVLLCKKCATAQIDYTVKKEAMYTTNTYLSGITRSLADHFDRVAKTVDERFHADKKQKSVLDIGSNDGTQLISYQKLGYDVLGVEAAHNVVEIAEKRGVPTRCDFFNLEVADKIGRSFDVINASGVFFHLEELHSVTEAIKKYLKPDGVFVVQFLYMKKIMENVAFDQIYHEHLLYYTLRTIDVLLKRHGLELFDAELAPIHGGSIMGYVGHIGKRSPSERLLQMKREEEESGCNALDAYRRFAEKIAQLKEKNLAYLQQKKREGKRIFGMGAPVKGNTLLNYFGIGKQYLDCLVEKNELRRHLFSPGMHLPVLIEKEIAPPDVYYVLAWNFKKEILQNNQHLIQKGVEFFFPIETA
ncbi:MAG: class I SAM-dependent methyltransferase [Chlamydiia bacterium]|nr:class I SAM-dependent methyltransferase [Chlamydiia bacterium]